MTEYFRILGLNDIVFDGPISARNYDIAGVPAGMSRPLTRPEVLAELENLPLEIRGHVLNRGLSVITVPFSVYGPATGFTDSDLEDRIHDIQETLQDARLYTAAEGAHGTRTQLRFQLDNASESSYKTVYWGEVDERNARTVFEGAIECQKMEGLRLTLYCEPHWRPLAATTLGPNEIYDPSFEEDGNADGEADNWDPHNVPALAMESTIVLHGCHSQKVTTNAANEGVESHVMVTPGGVTDAVAYVWVCRPAAGSDVRAIMRDTTAGVNRDTALLSAATVMAVGKSGQIWYRLDLSSNLIVAGNHELWVESVGAAATVFYIDKAFWKWDATAIPDEWIDHGLIFNHYDTTEGAAHEGHQNYIDVDDLKGDVQARLLMRVEWQQKADLDYAKNLIIARRTRQPPCKLFWWAEAEDANAKTNWAPGALARCSAGNRVTDNANVAGLIRIDVSPAGLIGSDEFDGKFDVYAAAYANDIDNTMLRLYSGELLDLRHYNLWKRLAVASKWQLVHLGEIPWNQFVRAGAVHDQLQIFVEYQKDAADTVELDFLWFIPKDEPEMRLDMSDLVVNVQSLQVGQWWAFDDSSDFDYAAREYLVPPLRSNTVVWRIGNYGLMPRIENRSYFVCETFDTPDEVYECHGAETDLQMIVNADYLPQYVSPLE